ncbi:hypothetical protein ABIF90_008114 [Bradyrhizobium japonicum]
MEEIKNRGEVVRAVVQRRISVPPIVNLELAYLQLRMVCELIALACLTAHGDVPETTSKRLTKAYNADQIMKALENLHPDFYPVPGRQVHDQTGKVVEVIPVDEPHLTKRELQRLYGECGDFLHRGNIEQLMKGRRLPEVSEIDTWFKKITVLLNHHQIQLIDPQRQLWVIMQAESDGKVHAFEFEKIEALPAPRE